MDKTLLVSVQEAARCLGIAEKTVRNWMSAGKFPVRTFRLGTRRLVRRVDLELFVSSLGGGQPIPVLESENVTSVSTPVVVKQRGRPRKTVGKGPEAGHGAK